MARPHTEIKEIRCNRLKQILEETKTTQKQLHEAINVSQQGISQMVNCKANVTSTTATAVIKLFPQYRLEWLMGFDDYKTNADVYVSRINSLDHTDKVVCALAELAGYNVYNIMHLNLDEEAQRNLLFKGAHYHICEANEPHKEAFISFEEWSLLKEEIYETIGVKLKHLLTFKKSVHAYPGLREAVMEELNLSGWEDFDG